MVSGDEEDPLRAVQIGQHRRVPGQLVNATVDEITGDGDDVGLLRVDQVNDLPDWAPPYVEDRCTSEIRTTR